MLTALIPYIHANIATSPLNLFAGPPPGNMDGVGNQSSHHKGGSGAHTLLEAAAPGEGKVKCIVPGCTVDLSTLDAYCRKANTCHEHQKAKVLDVKGRASRFCQQCVRIHDLARFDGDKRGCRKRLAQHNLR
mmetsp:Transcript_13001/g.36576  ORF Transcript_13001/g.36576 Transcript_13001/m.36576 type:complete len:132 (-) Transcript_13001:56-451(-)